MCCFIRTGLFLCVLSLGSVSSKLVPLHRHDSYSNCELQHGEEAVYCVAKSYIKPADNVQAWKDIIEHNKLKTNNFRHDSLLRSYCVNDCERRVAEMSNTTGLTIPKFDIDPWLHWPAPLVDESTLSHREKYWEVINICANTELQEYGLQSYSEIDFCLVKNEENVPKWDWLDFFCIAVILIIGGLSFLSTCYDYWLSTPDNPDHYKKYPFGASRTLLAFSFPRNFVSAYTFNKNKTDNFDYFEGLRILCMIFVTIIHSFEVLASISLANPQQLEEITHGVFYKFIYGGLWVNQVYFAISGFLVSLSVVKDINKGRVLKLIDFWDEIKQRYLRLTPVYAFAILLEMSLVRQLYQGPLWTQMAVYDAEYCRRSWWTNLLYVNNLYKYQDFCMLQTWYLSADIQLFIIRFFLLAIISRYPQLKKQIFAIAVLISYILPTYVTYVNGFDPIVSGGLEVLRVFSRPFKQFGLFHIPFYTNSGSYLIGIVTAFIYQEIKAKNIDVKRSVLFMTMWHLFYPVLFVLLSTSCVYFSFDFNKDTIYMAFYSAIFKNVWGILVGLLIIGYNAGMGGWMKPLLSWKLLVLLGKFNYEYFLLHMIVLKLIVGNLTEPFYFTMSHMVILIVNVEAVTYFCAGVVYVVIELPAANLQKVWTRQRPKLEANLTIEKKDKNIEINIKNNNHVTKI